jgi:hypothetical protein
MIRAAHLAPLDMPRVGGFLHAGKLISRAQRFFIQNEARDAVYNVLNSKPSSLLQATNFARLPFPITWLEWERHLEDQSKLIKGHYPVTRVGVLMQQVGARSIRLFTCWRLKNDPKMLDDRIPKKYLDFARQVDRLGISALEGAWDLDSINGKPAFEIQEAKELRKFNTANWFRRPLVSGNIEKLKEMFVTEGYREPIRIALNNPAELKAMQTLEKCACYRIHEEANGLDVFLHSQLKGNDANALIRDLEDEMAPALALIILLNSKNCVDIEPIEPPIKLNKALRKARKAELVKYSTVHLKLSRSQSNVADSKGHDGTTRARHLVKGHFKVRKTGVFWWSFHMAGSEKAGVVIRKGYEVEE